MTALTHLDWQPVILLKIVRLPFRDYGGLSLQRAYLALEEGRLLYADWTLEADERSAALVYPTGWTRHTPFTLPVRLEGNGARRIPAGTWLLPYSDALFTLYSTANASFTHLMRRIEIQPTDPVTLAALTGLTQLL